jgi:hypothetical protein
VEWIEQRRLKLDDPLYFGLTDVPVFPVMHVYSFALKAQGNANWRVKEWGGHCMRGAVMGMFSAITDMREN